MMSSSTFVKTDSRVVPALNLTVDSYRHPATGAEHHHLKADNPENVFLVGLRTAPVDSTGVAHILEHTVLCGSRRFPVHDPFFMMLRRSLNTFMNAFTSSDWTAYPFASQNRKDFFNLLEVYLDAVFFPRLEELDFAQEGHRLEFAEPGNPASPLTLRGVVYNEMQGAMANPVNFLWQSLARHLFPTSTYRFNSGGDPEIIPLLSYRRLKEFHRRNYHPGNAFFLTYGDIPAPELQEVFINRVLREFADRPGAPLLVAPEKRHRAPLAVTDYFPVEAAAGKLEDNRSHQLVGWLLESPNTLEGLIEAHLLNAVLLDNSSSPLLDTLETSSLGRAPSPLCGLDDDHRELVFCCGLEGCAAASGPEVEELVLSTLERVARDGIPYEQLEAALHQLELQRREIGGDGFPYGLQLMMTILPAVVHQGEVVERLDIGPVIERLRKKIREPDYISGLLRRLLLDNPHRVRLTMAPDPDLGQRRRQALRARLEARRRSLRAEDERALVARAATLAARQRQQDDPEILPRVGLNDVPSELPIPLGRQVLEEPPVTSYRAGTNGLVYQQTVLPLPELAVAELELLPDYIACLTELGCDGLDYRRTQAWQARVSGGISASYKIRSAVDETGRVTGYFTLSGRALNRNHGAMTRLLRRTLESVRFDEYDHIREIMAQVLAHQEQQVTATGHLLVMRAAAASCSPVAAMSHRTGGLAGLRRLKRVYRGLADKQEALEDFCRSCAQLHQLLLSVPGQFLLVGEAEREARLLEELRQGWRDFGPQNAHNSGAFRLPAPEGRIRQLWTTDTQVNFCAQAYRTVTIAHPDAAPLAVLGGFLRNGFLHRAIREEGGAYGGGAGHDPGAAAFRFYSYRDPRLAETLDDFRAALDWLQRERHESRQVEEAILGVISSIDKPGSPAGRAIRAFYDSLFGRTPELIREYRRRVLAVTLEDLKRVAATYLAGEPDGIAVLTSPQAARRMAVSGDFEVFEL